MRHRSQSPRSREIAKGIPHIPRRSSRHLGWTLGVAGVPIPGCPAPETAQGTSNRPDSQGASLIREELHPMVTITSISVKGDPLAAPVDPCTRGGKSEDRLDGGIVFRFRRDPWRRRRARAWLVPRLLDRRDPRIDDIPVAGLTDLRVDRAPSGPSQVPLRGRALLDGPGRPGRHLRRPCRRPPGGRRRDRKVSSGPRRCDRRATRRRAPRAPGAAARGRGRRQGCPSRTDRT